MTSPRSEISKNNQAKPGFSRLSALGYTTVPIIPHDVTFTTYDGKVKPGGKAPGRYLPSEQIWEGFKGWQGFLAQPPSAAALSRWESWNPAPGIGILTGRIAAVDIDVTHPELNDAILSLAADMLGATPFIRYGQKPKALLVYQVEGEPIEKMRSATFTLDDHAGQAVEVLGAGQQFVAYGIHPGTKKPYRWPEQNLMDCTADELPLVTKKELLTFIRAAEKLAITQFNAAPKTSLNDETLERKSGELEDTRGLITEAVRALPKKLADDYHTWTRVGHAIKAALPNDQGLAEELWEEFSAKSIEKFDQLVARAKFETFNPKRIGAGTLYKLAKDAGWQPSRPLPEDEFEPVFDTASLPDDAPLKRQNKPRITTFDPNVDVSLMTRRRFIIDKMAPRGFTVGIVAPPGVGKTTFTANVALAAATGSKDILGFDVKEPCKVWMINGEDDEIELQRRLLAAAQAHAVDPHAIKDSIFLTGAAASPILLTTRSKERYGALDRGKAIDEIKAFILAKGIGILIVDPLAELHEGDENDNSEMRAVMATLREIAVDCNAAVFVVHHTRKPPAANAEGHAGSLDSARGGSSWGGSVRTAFTLMHMTEADAKAYGIDPDKRGDYVRLDDAKANLYKATKTTKWYEKLSVALPNGDNVGALKPAVLTLAHNERENAVLKFVYDYLTEEGSPLSLYKVTEAYKAEANFNPMLCDDKGNAPGLTTIRRRLSSIFYAPTKVKNKKIVIVPKENGKSTIGFDMTELEEFLS